MTYLLRMMRHGMEGMQRNVKETILLINSDSDKVSFGTNHPYWIIWQTDRYGLSIDKYPLLVIISISNKSIIYCLSCLYAMHTIKLNTITYL